MFDDLDDEETRFFGHEDIEDNFEDEYDYNDDYLVDEEYNDDGQPSEYDEWQDYMGGDDSDFGQYDTGEYD